MNHNKAIAVELGLLFEASSDFSGAFPERLHESGLHILHETKVVHFSVPHFLRGKVPPLPSGKERFFIPQKKASLEMLLEKSHWFVCLGAALSPQLLQLCRSALVFVFEPVRERMDALLEELPLPVLARKNIVFFSGDPEAFDKPLLYLLPVAATRLGMPVFLARDGLPSRYMITVRRTVEIFYYHHQLYPYEGQVPGDDNRPVAGGYSFDQTRQLIENLGLLSRAGTVDSLHNLVPGGTALLVAAGPALDEQLHVIRRLAPHSLVICAGKACVPLLRHGVTPDIVLLMDSRPQSAAELAGLPLKDSVLVSYTLSGARAASWERTLFFGRELSQLGLAENMIEHLGSVMNYAFFLARFLGCERAVCAGLQLASRVRKGEGYAEGTTPLPGLDQNWPYPVRVPGVSEYVYTSLNFLDVAMWLQAEIRATGLSVINLTRDSLLFGPGIIHEPEPDIPLWSPPRPLPFPVPSPSPQTTELVIGALERYRETWTLLSEPEKLFSPDVTVPLAERFLPLLQKLDANGTTHLLKTIPAFRPAQFARAFFSTTRSERNAAAEAYLGVLRTAAAELKRCAEASLELWQK